MPSLDAFGEPNDAPLDDLTDDSVASTDLEPDTDPTDADLDLDWPEDAALEDLLAIENETLVEPETITESGGSSNPFEAYLHEIGAVPLLDGSGEVRLATLRQAGTLADSLLATWATLDLPDDSEDGHQPVYRLI